MLYQNEMLRTLHKFAAFARSKDPDEYYNYFDSESCACAQFQKHEGTFKPGWASFLSVRHSDISNSLQLANYLAAKASKAYEGPGYGTWGDLLKVIEVEIEKKCLIA